MLVASHGAIRPPRGRNSQPVRRRPRPSTRSLSRQISRPAPSQSSAGPASAQYETEMAGTPSRATTPARRQPHLLPVAGRGANEEGGADESGDVHAVTGPTRMARDRDRLSGVRD